jgi:hypothetical protein
MTFVRRLARLVLARALVLVRDPMNFLPLMWMEAWWRLR